MIKKNIKIIALVIGFNFMFLSFVLADTVYLKEGIKTEGKIIEETDDYIVIVDSQNSWRIAYHRKYIDKIVKDKLAAEDEHDGSGIDRIPDKLVKGKTDIHDNKAKSVKSKKEKPRFLKVIFGWFKRKK